MMDKYGDRRSGQQRERNRGMAGRILGLSLAAALLLGGCAGKTGTEGSGADGSAQSSGVEETERAMGRYVEDAVELGRDVYSRACGMIIAEDGSYELLDYNNGLSRSTDGGKTWEKAELPWFDELKSEEVYITDMAMAEDGRIAVLYSLTDAVDQDGVTVSRHICVFDREGNRQDVDSSQAEKEGAVPVGVWFSDTGRLFSTTSPGKVYEVSQEDHSLRLVCQTDGGVEYMSVQGDIAYLCGPSGVQRYDLAQSLWLEEDEVLNSFVREEADRRIGYSNYTDSYKIYLLPADEETVYLACSKGIYRHVMGGNAMEQLADGAMSVLSDPALTIISMLALDKGDFLILFPGMLVRYTYDPSVPSVPDTRLKVYSLEESSAMRGAVALYKKEHPDVYVEVEIGMEGDSMTREDALKNLNTRILSGEGPDFLMLDGMPLDSYMEKGLLKDIGPVLEEIDGTDGLLPGVKESFSKDGAVCAVPATIRIPLIVGRSGDISGITDLTSLADSAEALRQKNPEGGIAGWFSPKEALTALMMNSVPAWKTDGGGVDEAAVEDFLIQAKRLWDAETEGYSPGEMEEINQDFESMVNRNAERGSLVELMEYSRFKSAGDRVTRLMGDSYPILLDMGLNAGIGFDLTNIVSVCRTMEGVDWGIWNGQAADVYLPENIVGISAGTKQEKEAEELLRIFIGPDNGYGDGFPINRKALEQSYVNTYTGGDILGMMSVQDTNGGVSGLTIYWPTAEELERLDSILEQVHIPNLSDSALEAAVLEAGEKVLSGEISPEEGAKKIMEKTALRMAE